MKVESDGYNFARRILERCRRSSYPPSVPVAQKYSSEPTFEFCPIWKIGTTTIKRLFLIKNTDKYRKYINPYAISFLETYREKRTIISNTDDKRRFMFVRNPYDRLLSVYIDKLLAPNPVYWKLLGVPAIRATRKNASKLSLTCGHDVTFKEFVAYVMLTFGVTPGNNTFMPVKKIRDWHVESMTSLCRPCDINYDFVGKLETFGLDIRPMLMHLNLTRTDDLLQSNGSALAADDAIRDTTFQPFDKSFTKLLPGCNVTFLDALNRAWHKLQVRGLIGKQELSLSEETLNTLSYSKFLNMANVAHDTSSKEERRALKSDFYRSSYLTLDAALLDSIRRVYADDFRLFEYKDRLDFL